MSVNLSLSNESFTKYKSRPVTLATPFFGVAWTSDQNSTLRASLTAVLLPCPQAKRKVCSESGASWEWK